jgi:glycosidase
VPPLVEIRHDGQALNTPTPQIHRKSETEWTVQLAGLLSGKYQVQLSGRDPSHGLALRATAQAVISPRRIADSQTAAGDRADTVLYHVLIDRFRGPLGALPPPATSGQRAGGTFDGVRAAVEAGYFDQLGVTTLWLSPLYENAPGMQRGRDGNLYEAYHGYWPAQPRSVEPKLGTADQLEQLVQAAHRHGLRVLFDAVPNHVFASHPYYLEHGRTSPASQPDPARKSWFSDGPGACVCGTPGCGWGERIEDCWFDSYLPDLNLRNPEAASQQAADLLWWLSRFDLDGMRIDAVPMMPRPFTRRVVRAVADQATRRGLDVLLIGEDYTGPGDGGRFEIRSFLGDQFDGLHSAFDFPLFWATVDALARDRLALSDLEKQIALSQKVYGGSGAVMAHILNNHDTARFVSEAAGNAGNDPWKSPPPQPTETEPYQRQMLALTLLLTLPGIPVLYYGDEVGLAGAGDPDARRVLPDVLGSGLPPLQQGVLRHSQRLGQLRRCHPALRRGERTLLQADKDYTIALHTPPSDSGAEVVTVISRALGERQVQVRGIPPGRYRDVFSDESLTVSGDAAVGIALRPLRSQVFVRDGSPCL